MDLLEDASKACDQLKETGSAVEKSMKRIESEALPVIESVSALLTKVDGVITTLMGIAWTFVAVMALFALALAVRLLTGVRRSR